MQKIHALAPLALLCIALVITCRRKSNPNKNQQLGQNPDEDSCSISTCSSKAIEETDLEAGSITSEDDTVGRRNFANYYHRDRNVILGWTFP